VPRQSLALRWSYPDDQAAGERLSAIVRQHVTFVWRSLRRLGVGAAEADDATQSVLLLLARRLGEVEPGRERAFLFAAALRVASSSRRSAGRRPVMLDPSELDMHVHPGETPDALLERRRARELLDRILAELPLELGAVLVLHEIEELSVSEIAEVLDVKQGTVASRLRRARSEFEHRVRRIEAKLRFSGESP
jgi:RNA polymerase sigma-70 factor (ECF subfamily)